MALSVMLTLAWKEGHLEWHLECRCGGTAARQRMQSTLAMWRLEGSGGRGTGWRDTLTRWKALPGAPQPPYT